MSQKTDEPAVDLKMQLELKKIELECEKVRAEIASLPTTFWQRPAFAGSFSTVAVAIIGLVGGQLSGFFDTRQDRIQADVERLEAEKTLLEFKVDAQRSQAIAQLDDLTEVKQALRKAVDQKDGTYAVLDRWLGAQTGVGDGKVMAKDVLDRLEPFQKEIEILGSQLDEADNLITMAKKQLEKEDVK